MKREPITIDHNPHEKRMTNGIWWIVWAIVAIGWTLNLYAEPVAWRWLALGVFTGGVLATWAIEITGDKVPDSWRGKPTGRR